MIVINLTTQELTAKIEGEQRTFQISSAKNGIGQQLGSYQTPLGLHYVRAKIGETAPINTVFIGRRPAGEIFTEEMFAKYPGRDWILTRIFWLCGLTPGLNRHGKVDSMRRFIYIHGSPDCINFDSPGSRGCIRMRNCDIMQLFRHTEPFTQVLIEC